MRTRKVKQDRTAGRVLGYVRCSTDRQAESGASIEVQKAAIVAECERRGWTLVSIVSDDGYSGKDMRRPGLQSALAQLACGEADVLVAAKLDRLSRSVRDFAEIADQARHHGWTLRVLDADVDTGAPSGELLLSVLSAFAQFERRIIGQRTRDGLAVKKAQGVKLGRPRALPDDVREYILTRRLEGVTLAAIAAELTAKGVPTAQGGLRWYPSTVRAVIATATATHAEHDQGLGGVRCAKC